MHVNDLFSNIQHGTHFPLVAEVKIIYISEPGALDSTLRKMALDLHPFNPRNIGWLITFSAKNFCILTLECIVPHISVTVGEHPMLIRSQVRDSTTFKISKHIGRQIPQAY